MLNVSVGLKQGCILSPVLFNVYMEDLVQLVSKEEKSVKYGDAKVSVLLYAECLQIVDRVYTNNFYYITDKKGISHFIGYNNNISLLQTHGPYTYKKNVKHI